LERLLRACGIALRPEQYDALWAYHRLLRQANAELNLTRLHNFETMVLKHYADSLLVLKYEDLPSPLIDMGSGPGLPGVPLKIVRPEVEMVLAEPRSHRAEFLEQVITRLDLTGIEVHAGKIGRKFTRPVAGVITRAVASVPETLGRVSGCLGPGGRMLFMKGPDCDDEIAEARVTHGKEYRLAAAHDFTIPGTLHQRRLIVYERLGGTAMTSPGPMAREVTSAANPTFKHLRDLLSGRGIRKHGEALLAGPRIVADVLATHSNRALGWLSEPGGPPPPESVTVPWLRLDGPLFQELDVSGTHAPLLWVRVPEQVAWSDEAPWPLGCTLFVPLQDPENVGAVIRSAAAFGVARVVLLREAAHPFHPKSVRAAGPALFQVPMEQGPSIQELASTHVPIIALDKSGPDLASGPFPERFGLVVGVEGPGLPEHLRLGQTRRIPIAAGIESLNAAAATAVALYEWRRQQRS
jgi:16S rRNA (guanine527-N7)-methyltransferase